MITNCHSLTKVAYAIMRQSSLLFLFFLCSVFTFAQVPDDWTLINNNNEHIPRHENSFTQLGDRFYLFGGRESSQTVERYNYQNNTWDKVASAPKQFNHFQALEFQGYIWVIGAFQNNNFPNETPEPNIYLYDPEDNLWIQGPSIPVNRRRGSTGLVVYNDKFYVVCGNTIGHNGGYVKWFDVYDPCDNTWIPLADAPHARDHFNATVVGDNLYSVSGRLSGGPGGVFAPTIAEVDVYNLITNQWTTLPSSSNFPTPRAGTTVVNFQGEVVVLGGEGDGQAYDDVHAMNVNNNVWRALANMNFPRHGTQAIVSGDGIHITSGSNNQGGGSQTNMEYYGIDNPQGTAISASTISGPSSVNFSPGSSQTISLNASGGNQGVWIKSLSITGTDASEFNFINGDLSDFLIKANGSHQLTIQFNGTTTNKSANLQVTYSGQNRTIEIPLSVPGNPNDLDGDGVDNNADNCPTVFNPDQSLPIYYADMDGDGYSDGTAQNQCEADLGYFPESALIAISGDCNDNDSSVFPGAMEVCDGVDNDCDGQTDEGFTTDSDGDGVPDGCDQCQGDDATGDTDGDGLCDDIDPNPNGADLNILQFTLIDANIDQGVPGGDPLLDGTILDANALPGSLNIEAVTAPSTVGSVFLELSGPISESRTENIAPYALFGDSNGNFGGVSFPNGDYTMTATPYEGGNGSGEAGITSTIQFSIVDGVIDADGDGFTTDVDCDDNDDTINPDATEVCDGVDNNCDGQIDEGLLTTYYADADGDGFGDGSTAQQACSQPQGFVTIAGDCDDSDDSINPNATEVCDGGDNNCDGQTDEGLLTTYYADADGDGFGDGSTAQQACSQPQGFVIIAGDCDDSDDTINPNATEECDGVDNNCDGEIDEGFNTSTYFADSDGDGFGNPSVSMIDCVPPDGFVDNDFDCNDNDDSINPNAMEVCDGVDNNCDGEIDEGFNTSTYYVDSDGDGFGNLAVSVVDCIPPTGYVTIAGDCNDNDNSINPDAIEVCDGVDNDCDGQTDEGFDMDGDGFTTCEGDCNDTDDSIFPGATEILNDGIDQDCDGQDATSGLALVKFVLIDAGTDLPVAGYDPLLDGAVLDINAIPNSLNIEAIALSTDVESVVFNLSGPINQDKTESVAPYALFGDSSGDFGGVSFSLGNYSLSATPYDGNGGSGTAGSALTITFSVVDTPVDNDGDGFDATIDCDDNNDMIFPGATEVCDGVDNDCDGQTDEGLVIDIDGDGFSAIGSCGSADDCDDSDATVYPGAPEICDGKDNNCNSQIDEGLTADADGDGFTVIGACTGSADDCNDNDATIYPGAPEICDGLDNNCDGEADEGLVLDMDGDGFSAIGSCGTANDCDDNDDTVYPGAPEVPNDGIDQDCDGEDQTQTTGPDLELSISSSSPILNIWNTVTFTFTLTNAGTESANNIEVSGPVPSGFAYTSHNAIDGNYDLFFEEWTVASLAAGEVATLELVLFVLQDANPVDYYVQVLSSGSSDVDSSPGNNAGPIPVEDDEALVTLNTPGSNMGAAPGLGRGGVHKDRNEILSIYPNPASETLWVRSAVTVPANGVIRIRDVSGRLLLHQELDSKDNPIWQFNLNDMKAGLYLITISLEGYPQWTKRFLVHH